jgi:hypothetical protein
MDLNYWLLRAMRALPRPEVADTIIGGLCFVGMLWLLGEFVLWLALR